MYNQSCGGSVFPLGWGSKTYIEDLGGLSRHNSVGEVETPTPVRVLTYLPTGTLSEDVGHFGEQRVRVTIVDFEGTEGRSFLGTVSEIKKVHLK